MGMRTEFLDRLAGEAGKAGEADKAGQTGQTGKAGEGGKAGEAGERAGRVVHEPPGQPPASPVLRRARLAALAVGGFLLPWCVLLSMVLPATAQAQHWSLAWTGLDAAEALAALGTAVLLAHGDRRAALTAAAGAALLLTDAWFDVCTSAPGLDHGLALAEAACVEGPLAGAACWLALRLIAPTRQ
jgi:hypothetical protein